MHAIHVKEQLTKDFNILPTPSSALTFINTLMSDDFTKFNNCLAYDSKTLFASLFDVATSNKSFLPPLISIIPHSLLF